MKPKPTTTPTPIKPLEPLAVGAEALGAMLGLSVRTIRQLDAAGKLPKPVTIGARSIRWPVAEIEAWLAADAPDRATWNAIRKNGTAKR